MKDKTIACVWLGTLIAIVEVVALLKGIDGQLFLSSIGAIAGLFGYYIGKSQSNNRNVKPKKKRL